MPKFGALGSKSLKMKLKFEIDLFKIRYRLHIFKRQCQIWNFCNGKCFGNDTGKTLLTLKSYYFLAQSPQIWEFGLKFLKTKVWFKTSNQLLQIKFQLSKISLRLRKIYFMTQHAQIWWFGHEISKKQCQIRKWTYLK